MPRPARHRHLLGFVLAALALLLTSPPAPAVEAPFPMYLPVAPGATVVANGTHPFGGDFGTVNSVDIGGVGARRIPIFAAAAGVASVRGADGFGACYVVIAHRGGWETTYYHLTDVDRSIDGRRVVAGQRLGRSAQPGTQTCGVGSPNFPHVHFAISRNGRDVPIDGLSLGGYTIHQGGGKYCGWWTRDADRRIVVDARRICGPQLGLVNDLVLPPGTVLTPVVDTAGPQMKVTRASNQRSVDTVTVGVTCRDEACNARLTGTVTVPRPGRRPRTFTLDPAAYPLPAGRATTLRTYLYGAAPSVIGAAQGAGLRVEATVLIRVTDVRGNTTRATRTIRLV